MTIDSPHLEAATVAAYIDHRLSSEHVAAVEAHLADCDECRAEVVQLSRVIQPARPRRMFAIAGIAAAAVLLLFVLPIGRGRSGVGSDPSAGAAGVRALGAVAQPPVYLGVSVRGSSQRAGDLFAAGMRHYVAAEYADAATKLREAQKAGIEGAAAPFFLAASLLALDQPRDAADEFARAIALGESVYRGEAHYYRAKALLRLARAEDAVAALDEAIRAGDESMKLTAQSLKDSVRVARGR